WFADDFHFLDVARRLPVAQALTGQYGIYPWYRPLSRELFYEAIVACGPAAPMVAHALALVALFASAWLLFSLSRRRIAGPAAAVAPALFVCCDYTKFLTAWPSGFQDLLAVLLTLAAVEAHARGWTIRSRLAIALAPFAKETGFLAFPLVLAWSRFCEGERRVQPWMRGHALATIAALLVHVGVRLSWRFGGTAGHEVAGLGQLGAAMLAIVRGFLALGPTPGLAPLVLAVAAAIAALLL